MRKPRLGSIVEDGGKSPDIGKKESPKTENQVTVASASDKKMIPVDTIDSGCGTEAVEAVNATDAAKGSTVTAQNPTEASPEGESEADAKDSQAAAST